MQATIIGNVALMAHHEKLTYQHKRIKATVTHLFSGFLILGGVAAGISGCLTDN